MKYHLDTPKIIHFEFDKENVPDLEQCQFHWAPQFAIYDYEGEPIPEHNDTYRAEIRWTFRLHYLNKVVCSFICEQLCVLIYVDEPLAMTRLANILILSHFAVALEFDMVKPRGWLEQISLLDLDRDYIDEKQLLNLVIGMKTKHSKK